MTLSDYTPPIEGAGGIMFIRYTNGADTHRHRVHILAFNTAAMASGQGGGSTLDYAYSTVGAGMETSVAATFAAYVNQIKAIWDATWTFTLDELYSVVNHVPQLVGATPNPTAIAGTNSTPTGTLDRFTEQIYSYRTRGGNRARLVYIGGGGLATHTASIQTASNAVVGYVTGLATAIVGHDGTPLLAPAHVTVAQNRRLRRHYGQA